MTTIKPTQRDREAAIQRARELGAQMAVLEEMRELIRAGRCDDGTAVQTALKALNAERALERAAIVAMIERDFDAPHVVDLARRIAEAIARGE